MSSETALRSSLRPMQTLLLGSLMFGLFFGAGNLIFPISLGLQAGNAVTAAAIGFLVAAVGLPVLGVIGSALSRTSGLHELASRVAPWFGVAFTVALYLTIGPFFAIPRTATVSYEMAFGGSLDGAADTVALLAFTVVFFGLALVAALRPGRLLDTVGRHLTPLFLVLLGILLIAAFLAPQSARPEPIGPYVQRAAAQGILDGYNTMDALASLAFAIVIIEAARKLGVQSSGAVAKEIAKSGVVAAVLMGAIYLSLAFLGAGASGIVDRGENGAVGLGAVAMHHFGSAGHVLASAIMLVACLKTAIGLIVACSEVFATMFPRVAQPRTWTFVFTGVSFALANVGLETIIAASIPVLQLLYPLAITMILLGLLDRWVRHRPWAYRLSMLGAGVAAVLAQLFTLGDAAPVLARAAGAVGAILPGFELGFGWLLPALVGLVAGMIMPSMSDPVPRFE